MIVPMGAFVDGFEAAGTRPRAPAAQQAQHEAARRCGGLHALLSGPPDPSSGSARAV